LSTQGFGGQIDDWEQVEFDLSAHAGNTATLRWTFASDYSVHSYYGWYIDDVLIGDPSTSYEIPIVSNDDPRPVETVFLHQNFPNPVRNSTTFSFALPHNVQTAELSIYNVKGQLVKTFSPNIDEGPFFDYEWNGKDNANKPVANGVYFYRLTTDKKEITKKKVYVEAVMNTADNTDTLIMFDRNPFSKTMPTRQKLLIIESILKTIRENGIKAPKIRFLVNNQTLVDPHLDFSISWPLEGFFE